MGVSADEQLRTASADPALFAAGRGGGQAAAERLAQIQKPVGEEMALCSQVCLNAPCRDPLPEARGAARPKARARLSSSIANINNLLPGAPTPGYRPRSDCLLHARAPLENAPISPREIVRRYAVRPRRPRPAYAAYERSWLRACGVDAAVANGPPPPLKVGRRFSLRHCVFDRLTPAQDERATFSRISPFSHRTRSAQVDAPAGLLKKSRRRDWAAGGDYPSELTRLLPARLIGGRSAAGMSAAADRAMRYVPLLVEAERLVAGESGVDSGSFDTRDKAC